MEIRCRTQLESTKISWIEIPHVYIFYLAEFINRNYAATFLLHCPKNKINECYCMKKILLPWNFKLYQNVVNNWKFWGQKDICINFHPSKKKWLPEAVCKQARSHLVESLPAGPFTESEPISIFYFLKIDTMYEIWLYIRPIHR